MWPERWRSARPRSLPPPVQGAILDRLRHMARPDLLVPGEIRDRARHLEDPMVGSCGEAESSHRGMQ